jgi:hypothetical protein
MKKATAIVVLGAMLLAVLPVSAHAHGAASAALALGAFAVFSTLFLPFAIASAVVAPPYYAAPAPVYATAPPVYYAPSYAPPRHAAPVAPAVNREVVYPHGRYLLYGDGMSAAYRWVWVPNPPPPDSAPPSPVR